LLAQPKQMRDVQRGFSGLAGNEKAVDLRERRKRKFLSLIAKVHSGCARACAGARLRATGGKRMSSTIDAIDNVSREQLEWLIHQSRLRFPHSLERSYQRDYFERSLHSNRIALISGLAVMALFGLLDRYAAPHSLAAAWFFRYAIACPVLAAALAVSYSRWYFPNWQAYACAAALIGGLSIVAMIAVSTRGEIAYSYYVYGLMPVLAFMYTVPRLAFRASVTGGATLTTAYIALALIKPGYLADIHDRAAFTCAVSFLTGVNAAGILAAFQSELSSRRQFLQREMIARERRVSESLLLNILPGSVAARLKRGETVADQYDRAVVLFADLVDFTLLSRTLRPDEVISLLNDIFSRFDRLAERYGLEKIKTIGDAYMAVSGVPVPRGDYAKAAALMALDMREEIRRFNAQTGRSLALRIGLHAGPLVAGVIGLRKFIYDLWGDTVNTASRMESSGVAGEIQVSGEVYRLLRDSFVFESRGEREIKGKGTMHLYLLKGALDKSDVKTAPA